MLKKRMFFAISALILFISACSTPSSPSPASTPVLDVIPTLTPVKIPLTEAEVPRVALEDAKTAFDNNTAILVDVRGRDAFKASHIPNAFSIQLGEFETRLDKIKLPKDQWIITYCT